MSTNSTLPAGNTSAAINGANISELLMDYLKQNGYKIVNDEITDTNPKEEVITVSKRGRKELIQVKGFRFNLSAKEAKEEVIPKKNDSKLQAMQWFSEALFSSFVSFGKYFRGEKVTPALCLPDTERYRHIIENVQDYFTENKLDMKVYLVSHNGNVKEWNLNQSEVSTLARRSLLE